MALNFVRCLLFCSIFTASSYAGRGETSSTINLTRQDYNELVDQVNSMSGLLFQLAGAQYLSLTNGQHFTVFSTNAGASVLKYTDGSNTLVSLPTLGPSWKAVKLYVNQLNAFNIERADQLARQHEYNAAKHLLLLVEDFDPDPTNSISKKEVARRLDWLKEIEAGSKTAATNFLGLDKSWLYMPIRDIQTKVAVPTNSIRDLKPALSIVSRRQSGDGR